MKVLTVAFSFAEMISNMSLLQVPLLRSTSRTDECLFGMSHGRPPSLDRKGPVAICPLQRWTLVRKAPLVENSCLLSKCSVTVHSKQIGSPHCLSAQLFSQSSCPRETAIVYDSRGQDTRWRD